MLDQSTTPGTYLRSCREAAGRSLADVAADIATEPRWAEHIRIEQLELIEADVQPAGFATIVALSLAYPIDFATLVTLTKTPAIATVPAAATPAEPPGDARWGRLNQLPIGDQRNIVLWLRDASGDHRALGYWTGQCWAYAPISVGPAPLPFRPFEFWRPAA